MILPNDIVLEIGRDQRVVFAAELRAELHRLWIRELHADNELNAIWALSMAERWSFTIFPHGDVRFAALNSN